MMSTIIGLGLDATEVGRVSDVIDRYGERFLRRIFTESEIGYCLQRRVPAIHFAGRFAAKEAFLKALKTGWRGRITWLDIEVLRDQDGVPSLNVSGEARTILDGMGAPTVHLSISHTTEHAVAQVILEKM